MDQKEIRHPDLPFTVRVRDFHANSVVEDRPPNATAPPAATQDVGARAIVRELPRTTDMDERDVPSAVIELRAGQTSLGTWLVSEYIRQPQGFVWNQRTYRLELRPRRFYQPFSLQLLSFHNDLYAGTDIPKNYSSRVLLQRPETGEKREILIYMNNPLRYGGETFYQANYDPDNKGTVLQVVRNPGWLTPYLSCVLVGVGLIVQFATHLWGFSWKRRTV